MNSNKMLDTPFNITQTKGMVAVMDDTGCITAANEAFLHFLQLPQSAVLHKNLAHLVVPDEK